jgi:uncharacterized membrane protein
MDSSLQSPTQTRQAGRIFPRFNEHAPFHPKERSHSVQYSRDVSSRNDGLVKALGWFSVGLGIAQLMAPRAVSRMTGVGDKPQLVRALGLREIASGIGILSQRNPSGWLWSRVAGDAMDLALLGRAARSPDVDIQPKRVALVAAAVTGVAVLDLFSSVQHRPAEEGLLKGVVDVEKFVTINRSAEDCYRFWRNFQNFPRFMKHLEAIQLLDDRRSHWTAKGPAGTKIEWDAELTVDQPGKLLAWHSTEGADINNGGTVSFERAPGGRGTIVRVQMQYNPLGGQAGAMIAKLFGEEPGQQIDDDLRRFKQLIETGEITTTDGQPSGPRSVLGRLLHKGVQK